MRPHKIIFVCLALVCWAVVSSFTGKEWVRVECTEANCSVMMPKDPAPRSDVQKSDKFSKSMYFTYDSSKAVVTYLLVVTKLLDPSDTASYKLVQENFGVVGKTFGEKFNGKNISCQELTYKGYPRRNCLAETLEGKILIEEHHYFFEDCICSLILIRNVKKGGKRDAQKFFDSFQYEGKK